LLSFPNCDLEKQNKFGFKPSEIVCERKGDKSVKSEILKLFEARVYIPLLRDDFSAQIGEPFEGRIEDKRVSGLAGPMSPQQADALYNTLKSPRRCTLREKRIRLTDPQKGLERIARTFCKEMNVNWIEFWPFLNTCINLSSDEGLNRLEHHLRDVYFVCFHSIIFTIICPNNSTNDFMFSEWIARSQEINHWFGLKRLKTIIIIECLYYVMNFRS
jgi:hypothetical protein